jgi:hypothetical protein
MCNDNIYHENYTHPDDSSQENLKYSTEKVFYVYVYFDPDTKVPFYVGKGKGKRKQYHFNLVKSGKDHENKIMNKILKTIISNGKRPLIEVVCSRVSERTALMVEADLIEKFGRIFNSTGTLANFSGGWECSSNFPKDKNTYELVHRDGRTAKGYQFELTLITNLNPTAISNLVRGLIHQVRVGGERKIKTRT